MSSTPDYEKMFECLVLAESRWRSNKLPMSDWYPSLCSAICEVDTMIRVLAEPEIGEHDCDSGCPCGDEEPKYTGPEEVPDLCKFCHTYPCKHGTTTAPYCPHCGFQFPIPNDSPDKCGNCGKAVE